MHIGKAIMNRRFVFTLLLAATIAFVTSPGRAEDLMRMTMAASEPVFGPYYVAIDKGYFAQQGLTVEIVAAGGGAATPALISGDVQFSTSSASALSAIVRGAKIKVVMVLSSAIQMQIWSTQADIKTLADLKGKQIGLQTRGDLSEFAIRAALSKAGMTVNDVGLTPVGYGGRLAIARSGSLPAVILSNMEVKVARADGGLAHGHMVADIGREFKIPSNGLVTADKLLATNPGEIKRFMRATLMGMAYMRKYRAGTMAILEKHVKNTPTDILSDTLDDALRVMPETGTIPVSVQENEIAMRREMLNLPADKLLPASDIYDFSLVRQVAAELKASNWTPSE
jgi:putative hydroxymethylpyrimidine transport system substrate-binding protein